VGTIIESKEPVQDQKLEVAEQFLSVPCLQEPSLPELSHPTNVMLLWLPGCDSASLAVGSIPPPPPWADCLAQGSIPLMAGGLSH